MADQQWDLGVAHLVQRAQVAIVRQALSRPKAGHPQRGDRTGVLRERKRAVVELVQLHPAGIEIGERAGLAERGAHPQHGGVLVPLVGHVFA